MHNVHRDFIGKKKMQVRRSDCGLARVTSCVHRPELSLLSGTGIFAAPENEEFRHLLPKEMRLYTLDEMDFS